MHALVQRIRLPYLTVALALLLSGVGAVASPAVAGLQLSDTTPPVISGNPGNQYVEATGPEGATWTWTALTAVDDVSGIVPVTCTPPSGSFFPLDTTTVVNCSAVDAAGNEATTAFWVVIRDKTVPWPVTVPSSLTVEAAGPAGALVSFSATASDTVDGVVPVTCNPPANTTFPLGTSAVVCWANDSHGNATIVSFPVYVVDTTAPVLSGVPADITVQAADASGAVVTFVSPSAVDIVDGNLTSSCDPPSGSVFPIGTTWVSCHAVDAAGNSASASFRVTVEAPPHQLTRSGFYAPVTMDGSRVNTVKGGATVPLKFEVFDGGTEVTDTSVVGSFTVNSISCASGALEDPVDFTTTGGTTLYYDAASGQFIQHWKTPRTPGCYRVTLSFANGAAEPIVADFRVK
jgi:hypothetical protein